MRGGHRPVVVLAGAVDVGKGLFVEQAHKAVAEGHPFHGFHRQLVVVAGNVRGAEDGRQFMLAGGHLVVLGLGHDAQFPEFLVELVHKRLDAGLDGAEIVVAEFLPFEGRGTEKGAAAHPQVRPFFVEFTRDEEIFLLRAHRRVDGADVGLAEQFHQAPRAVAQALHRAQEGGLFVKRVAAEGAEGGRYVEGAVAHEGRGRRVPGGVAAGLKGGAQAPVREGGGVGLAAHEGAAGKLHDDLAVARRLDEAVVLFGGNAGQRLEPVGEVRGAALHGPDLHRVGHGAGNVGVQRRAAAYRAAQGAVDVLRQALPHHAVAEHHATEHFGDPIGVFHFLLLPDV